MDGIDDAWEVTHCDDNDCDPNSTTECDNSNWTLNGYAGDTTTYPCLELFAYEKLGEVTAPGGSGEGDGTGTAGGGTAGGGDRAMIYVKDSGRPCVLSRGQAWATALAVAHEAARPMGYSIRITSSLDRTDAKFSYHMMGEALDLTLAYDDGVKLPFDGDNVQTYEAWAARAKKQLGKLFDVFLHGQGDERHLHIEYDPKGRF